MNQEKIGKFIAENRKKKKLTQEMLAEKLGVTSRAVSNWENGKNMPDLSLFKPLCDIFEISINDLMSGEIVDNKNYTEKFEENIINTISYVDKNKEKKDNINSFIFLIASIIGICLTEFLLSDYAEKDYIIIICLILIINSLKRFFTKYLYVRKIVAILLIIICILALILK